MDMHLLKIQKVLEYLRKFPEEQSDDLVLVVDGYDVWFQLTPEVLIGRYFAQRKTDEARLDRKYGPKVVKENEFRPRVYFGNDKFCWPLSDEGRPACWAVPQSTMPSSSYGPIEEVKWFPTDEEAYHYRARWLNSGTIVGPVSEMLRMFEAAAMQVQDHYKVKSDQYYFGKLFGYQEYARLLVEPNRTIEEGWKRPDLKAEIGGRRAAEQHGAIDYESYMIQAVGFFDPFLTWLQYDGSIQSGRTENTPVPSSEMFELEEDIKAAQPPMAALKFPGNGTAENKNIRMRLWHELPLLTNVISKHIPAIIHFIQAKEYRTVWWDRMWFAPFARDLFVASAIASNMPILRKALDGRLWKNAERPVFAANANDIGGRRDGAWSDQGLWQTWENLCQAHEEDLFKADRTERYT
ncbi:hypothetical protein MMC21_008403 [Puttea exsequens]|nr:hypothetical protein [Puttea exsequens]